MSGYGDHLGCYMPELLFDSDEPGVLLLPALAGCRVATYADLLTPSLVSEFGPRLIAIDRRLGDPLGLATVVDIEQGAYSITDGVARVREFLAQRRPMPAAYHDRNDWAAVAAGLAGTSARHWVATLDGTATPDGQRPAAVQILGADKVGFHADLSIVWDDTWHPVGTQIPPTDLLRLQQLASTVQGPASALFSYIASLLDAVRATHPYLPGLRNGAPAARSGQPAYALPPMQYQARR